MVRVSKSESGVDMVKFFVGHYIKIIERPMKELVLWVDVRFSAFSWSVGNNVRYLQGDAGIYCRFWIVNGAESRGSHAWTRTLLRDC